MATIPTGTFIAAQRCRQMQQRAPIPVGARSPDPSCGSPIGSPESTPPTSPINRDPQLSLTNPLAKLHQLLRGRSMSMETEVGASASGLTHQLLRGRAMSMETEVGASASGLTQSLEASHHTSSITSMT